jgi:hypothetical protein
LSSSLRYLPRSSAASPLQGTRFAKEVRRVQRLTQPHFSKEANHENHLSIIKADLGSIGGHVTPSEKLLDTITLRVGQTAEPVTV